MSTVISIRDAQTREVAGVFATTLSVYPELGEDARDTLTIAISATGASAQVKCDLEDARHLAAVLTEFVEARS